MAFKTIKNIQTPLKKKIEKKNPTLTKASLTHISLKCTHRKTIFTAKK